MTAGERRQAQKLRTQIHKAYVATVAAQSAARETNRQLGGDLVMLAALDVAAAAERLISAGNTPNLAAVRS